MGYEVSCDDEEASSGCKVCWTLAGLILFTFSFVSPVRHMAWCLWSVWCGSLVAVRPLPPFQWVERASSIPEQTARWGKGWAPFQLPFCVPCVRLQMMVARDVDGMLHDGLSGG